MPKKRIIYICEKKLVSTYQLTELHNQEERDAFTALPQTLKYVGMFEAPEARTRHQRLDR